MVNLMNTHIQLFIAHFRWWNRGSLVTLFILSILYLPSCVNISTSRSSVTVGKALNENLINNIEIKKTTMSDIFRWFGAPHHIVHGKGYEAEGTVIAKGELTPPVFDISDVRWVHERSLDSVYANWVMFIYEFHASYAKKDAHGVTILPVTFRDSEDNTTIGKDELIIFIDDKSQLVENYGFRKEIGD